MKTNQINHRIEPREGCVASALKILGNKWTALILLETAEQPKRFCQIEKDVSGINPRTLTKRLDELVEHQILSRETFAEAPPRVQYKLTKKGYDFIPILRQMAAWGTKYHN